MINIRVLSLFDGMACGMIAMKRGGYQVDSYDAYEIDKYAIQSATHNFPEIVEHGDVFNADFTEYKDIDFLMGGSPCTHWSIAQTKHRETEASGIGWELFSQYVKALREVKPKYFIYENNKSMSKAIRESIAKTFGFDAICINSALVSAQNRQRLYWVGKRNEDGTYSKVDVQQPEDRGILLRDILDGAVDLTSNDKAWTLTASYQFGVPAWNTIERHQRNLAVEPVKLNAITEPVACRCRGRKDKNGNGYAKYECRSDHKSNTLDTNTANGSMVAEPVNTPPNGKNQTVKTQVQQTGVANIVKYKSTYGASGVVEIGNTSRQVGALPRPNGELSTSQAFRVYDTNAKLVTLKAGGGGAGGKTGLYAIPIEFENGVPTKAISSSDGKTYKVYYVINGTIKIKEKDYPIKLQDGYYIIRKLSVNECKRLQQVPDWYEFPVSDSQAYKQLGNGWSIEVILHLINSCLGDVAVV